MLFYCLGPVGPSWKRVYEGGNVLSQCAATVRESTVTDAGAGPELASNPRHVPSKALLKCILTSLDGGKAEDVVSISLAGKSEIGDYMVIASGRSTRQVVSLADRLTERLKRDLGLSCKVEGRRAGDWILIDAGDVIVHVFRPEVREFYQLEKMWMTPDRASASNN